MAPRSGRTRRIPVYAIVLIVAAVGLAAYWNGLKAPFIWDDDPAIVSNPTIRSVLPLSESLSPPLETPTAGRPRAKRPPRRLQGESGRPTRPIPSASSGARALLSACPMMRS